MARPKANYAEDNARAEGEETPATKRVQITHYKVPSSMGRLIAGQREHLPAGEADALIAKGYAKEC